MTGDPLLYHRSSTGCPWVYGCWATGWSNDWADAIGYSLSKIIEPEDYQPFSRSARLAGAVDAKRPGRKGGRKPVFYDRKFDPRRVIER